MGRSARTTTDDTLVNVMATARILAAAAVIEVASGCGSPHRPRAVLHPPGVLVAQPDTIRQSCPPSTETELHRMTDMRLEHRLATSYNNWWIAARHRVVRCVDEEPVHATTTRHAVLAISFDPTGAVSDVTDRGAEPDSALASCLARSFGGNSRTPLLAAYDGLIVTQPLTIEPRTLVAHVAVVLTPAGIRTVHFTASCPGWTDSSLVRDAVNNGVEQAAHCVASLPPGPVYRTRFTWHVDGGSLGSPEERTDMATPPERLRRCVLDAMPTRLGAERIELQLMVYRTFDATP